MRSGRRDEDVECDVAIDLSERRERVGTKRGLLATRFDDAAHERAKLVPPGQTVVTDAYIPSVGADRDGGKPREALGLLFHSVGHTVAEFRQPFAHPDHLGTEVDVAGPGPRGLLRSEPHEKFDRPF